MAREWVAAVESEGCQAEALGQKTEEQREVDGQSGVLSLGE